MKILDYCKAKKMRDTLKEPPMDVDEYRKISISGGVCPYCGSEDVEEVVMDFDNFDEPSGSNTCSDCKSEWIDIYKPKTEDENVGRDGFICPFCGSDDLEGWEAEYVGKEASINITCQTCDETWSNAYSVVEYHKKQRLHSCS